MLSLCIVPLPSPPLPSPPIITCNLLHFTLLSSVFAQLIYADHRLTHCTTVASWSRGSIPSDRVSHTHTEKPATHPTFELSHPRPEALFAGTVFERFNLVHVHSSLVAVPCTLSWSSLSYKALLPLFVSPCSWDVSVDSFVLLHSTCTDLQLAHPAQATPVCVCTHVAAVDLCVECRHVQLYLSSPCEDAIHY